MFERYSEPSRRAIFFARYEAQQYGSSHIQTEHLLLGLLHDESSLEQILGLRKHDGEFRSQVNRIGEPLDKKDLPLSNESKRVLAYTAEEPEILGHYKIEPEHLVLGLLREKNAMAAKMLRATGLEVQQARIAIAKYRGTSLPPPPSAEERSANRLLRWFVGAAIILVLVVVFTC